MDWKTKIRQVAEVPGKFLANSGHTQQDIPSQHRLLNAVGMFGAWYALDKVRDIIFGYNQKTEGEYVEVKREDVPAPLRFLHKSIDWDPNSDAPSEQWKKVIFQLLPGVGAGAGAVAGSMYAFERNHRAQQIKTLQGIEKLNVFDADALAQYSQSTPLRVLSGIFGSFSSASGLTFLYGAALNSAFIQANGGKVFNFKFAKGNLGPSKVADAAFAGAIKSGQVDESWLSRVSHNVLEPIFGHKVHDEASQKFVREKIETAVEAGHASYTAALEAERAAGKLVNGDLSAKTKEDLVMKFKDEISRPLVKEFVHEPSDMTLGNANPMIRAPIAAAEHLVRKSGIVKSPSHRERVLEHAGVHSADQGRG